jgi:hypothetical protein
MSTRRESDLLPSDHASDEENQEKSVCMETTAQQAHLLAEIGQTTESESRDTDTTVTIRPRAPSLSRGRGKSAISENKFSMPPKPTRGPIPSRLFRPDRPASKWIQKWIGGRQGMGKILVWLAMLALGIVWTWRAHVDHKHVARKKVRLAERLRWAANYLSSSCDADGRFR